MVDPTIESTALKMGPVVVYTAEFPDGLWRVVTVSGPFREQDQARTYMQWMLSSTEDESVVLH